MRSLPSSWARGALLIGAVAMLALFAEPSPPLARANVACDLGGKAAEALSGGVEAITGLVGAGNPLSDACSALGGALTGPLSGALKGLGNDVFAQITSWVSEGASWLIGKVVRTIERSTTPRLATAGFLAQYAKMAAIAALLGAAMLLAAVLEGMARGDTGMLVRAVVVNLPLAFIATSVAYTVVQLLLHATDGLCEAIADASGHDGTRFFEAAITGLGKGGGKLGGAFGGGAAGEVGGTVGAPLFVTFLAAGVGALAAFLVWIELLMRDAAVYVVALFMPFSLAASIWPRWTGVLRRTAELLITVIGSKFVIVAIIALAAGLLAEPEGRIEPILAASALMLLACFAPFVLLKFVPFAEGAMAAAYGRRSAAGGTTGAVQVGRNVQFLHNMARSNRNEGSGVTLWSAAEASGGTPRRPGAGENGTGQGDGGGGSGDPVAGKAPRRPPGAAGSPTTAGGRAGTGASAGAASGSSGAAGTTAASPATTPAAPATAGAEGARATAKRLSDGAVAKGTPRSGASPQEGGGQRQGSAEQGNSPSPPGGSESPPRPKPDPPGVKDEKGQKK